MLVDGPFQWYFLFGMIQNVSKVPVNLQFRVPLNHRLLYQTVEVDQHVPDTGRIIERREVESVEKVVGVNKTVIHVMNLKAKVKPRNVTRWDRLMKRPYFDRLEERELQGDLRSRDLPFGYAWMLYPSPSSLMTPKIDYREGQKWSVKMSGDNFQIHYELTKVDHQEHTAYVDGRNGVCLNGAAGTRKWNASWVVDTRSGVIKRMELDLYLELQLPKRTVRTQSTKVLQREADENTVLDYETDDDYKEDL